MNTSKALKISLFLLCLAILPMFTGSCGKVHDKIYGKQSINVINETSQNVSVYRQDKQSGDWQIVGTVGKNASANFEMSGIDCNYQFKAIGSSDYWNATLDVCGGVSWTLKN